MKIPSSFIKRIWFVIGIVSSIICYSCATTPSSHKAEFCLQGLKAYENRDWDNTIHFIHQALETDSSDNFFCVYQYRPLAYARKGKYTEAIADANLIANMRPNDLRSYIARCEVLSRYGAHKEALTDCEAAIKMIPTNPTNMIMPGNLSVKSFYAFALIRAGRIDEGLALVEAIAKEGNAPQFILFAKAEVLDEVGRHKEALLAYKEALLVNDVSVEARKSEKAGRAIYGGMLGYLTAGKKPELSEGMLEFAKQRIDELERLK
ncbi:MAG: tetratricopeptide repeat protein [Thermodesulfovibrionales bacterium]